MGAMSRDPTPARVLWTGSLMRKIDIFMSFMMLCRYNNSPVEDWYGIQASIQIPPLQRTFEGIFGYILTLLVDPDTVDQIVAPLLDLLGVDEKDKEFMNTAFLPKTKNASKHHFLGLRKR